MAVSIEHSATTLGELRDLVDHAERLGISPQAEVVATIRISGRVKKIKLNDLAGTPKATAEDVRR